MGYNLLMNFFYIYLISIPIFVTLNLLWIGFFAKNLYQSRLGYLLGDVNWLAAAVFYLLFLAGLTFFAIEPAVASASVRKAVLLGAFFGTVAYATYDLTNQATIRDWPLVVTIIDIIWGAFLGGVVSALTFLIYKSLA